MIKNYLRKKYLFLVLLAILISSLTIGCNLFAPNSNKNTQIDSNKMLVHYIDVGQGDSILIQVNNKNLLIDAGPNSDKKKLLNYLSALNLETLDYVIATHPHEDHIGNMDNVINDYNVLAFYSPKVQSTTKAFEKMVESLKSKNLKINVIKKGTDSIDLGENTKVTVFSPNKDYYEDLNNYSPVIKIEYGKTSFLFTGDAQKDVEKEILATNEDISADVLKVGHHGSSTSTTNDFLKKVNPSLGVISVGQDNTYNHPNDGTIKRLNDNKVTIYRTDKDGTVILSSDGSKITKK
ncbi:metallo beta-lactamase superfamily lipoprotein [Clostridium gelidum]|uniref:Metallo beta-lactamase superfamily lipoprotein n=1 Tax=Clostridium gelidum TaxID=704125 RepID=A0ABM7TAI8_9CLOT|nr:ComEC/Rec2 family competence protein [Clostridium gelidum]BCZ48318.1 metallo beta-lactamase superfamily lipoprotein [Clostridium gelidum]